MSEARPSSRIARRVGAVLAGLVVIFVLSTATDLALHASGIYPPMTERMADPLFLLALAYRIAYGIVGCYLTARLAPDQPLLHALVLGALGVLFGTAGAMVMWSAGPAWYSLAVIAIALPCAWAGATLHLMRSGARSSP